MDWTVQTVSVSSQHTLTVTLAMETYFESGVNDVLNLLNICYAIMFIRQKVHC